MWLLFVHVVVVTTITGALPSFVVLSGLSVGKQLTLKLLLQEAMLYTVGFAP